MSDVALGVWPAIARVRYPGHGVACAVHPPVVARARHGRASPAADAEPARAMGFCLFNNIAVAARRARDEHGAQRVLILDWDVHHGNGTNDIFHADPGVLFVSIHQSPLYPGTGAAADTGEGPGAGY